MEKYKNTMIPLGSFVELKSGNKAMIIGYAVENKSDKKRYDYLACGISFGFAAGVKLFNYDDVKKVIFNGYSNDPLIDIYNKKMREELNNG